MIELGSKVRDEVSGFEGIAFGRSEFLNGCVRIGVQPRIGADGKLPESAWFDEPQLEVIECRVIELPQSWLNANAKMRTGGPIPSIPTQHENPK